MDEQRIIVFCSSTCGPCHALCEWLDYYGLPYEKVLTDDPRFPSNIYHIPTIQIGEDRVGGFNRMAISKLLHTHGYLDGDIR